MNGYETVQKFSDTLPVGVRSFALKPEYWDPQSPLCPHDACVENLDIREDVEQTSFAEPVSKQYRKIVIQLRVLGWSHENLLTFCYDRVVRYSITLSVLSDRGNRAHGDWLHDTIGLGQSGSVVHKIRFSSGAEWVIECEDIHFSTTSV